MFSPANTDLQGEGDKERVFPFSHQIPEPELWECDVLRFLAFCWPWSDASGSLSHTNSIPEWDSCFLLVARN
jgi:hypothetical protein